MGKVLFRQYVWLINLLKRNKKLTFKEINSYWVNSIYNHEGKKLIPRTFKNWRDTILEEFQVDIVTVNNRYYQINNPEALERDSSLRWMMESISIHETIADSKNMKGRVLLESVPSSHHGLLTIVMNAMKEGKLLSMNYRKFNDDSYNPAKTVAPMCVKMHQRRWYMLAKVVGEEPKDDDPSPFKKFGVMKVYALDRIKALYELDETFEFP